MPCWGNLRRTWKLLGSTWGDIAYAKRRMIILHSFHPIFWRRYWSTHLTCERCSFENVVMAEPVGGGRGRVPPSMDMGKGKVETQNVS